MITIEISDRRAKLTAKGNWLVRTTLAEWDEPAEPMVRKIHRRGTAPDSIHGLLEWPHADADSNPNVTLGLTGVGRAVEHQSDSELRDAEQIPLTDEGGIEGFLRREVLPYAADA